MKKFVYFLLLLSLSAFANDIDTYCPALTYNSAPQVDADIFVCHQEYAVAYRYATKTAIYTTEYLTKEDTGSFPRPTGFKPDPMIPKEHSATVMDYLNTTTQCGGARCDRGHLTPAQDFSSCEICLNESFYLSNAVPQNYQNNQIIWRYLETKVRTYVTKRNPVYVITGPVYTKVYHTLGNGVAVPDRLFKVIIDSITGKSISFMMGNAHYPVGDLNGKIVPLIEIEMITGITFNPSLDKNKSASYQEWFSALK